MNRYTIFIVTAMIVMTLVLAILGGFWHNQSKTSANGADANNVVNVIDTLDFAQQSSTSNKLVHWYIEIEDTSSFVEGVFTFVRYFQLLSLFLPTSLFVSVEFLKVAIAFFIFQDWRLMSKEKARTTSVRNMSIVEDLGMVHYIFSDKTGTLTRN